VEKRTVADSDDSLMRVLAKLKSLRTHLPQTLVPEEFVAQYHSVLSSLRPLGYPIGEWTIPDHWMSTISDSGSKKRYVARDLLLTRLDAVLAFIHSARNAGPPRVSQSSE